MNILVRLKDDKRGTTIAEALVVIFIFVIISVALVSLYIQLGQLSAIGKAQFETVGSVRSALNGISTYAVQARRVVSTTTIASTLYTTGTSTLILELPAITAGGDIIEGAYDYVVFYTSSTAVYRALAPNASSARTAGTRFLTDNVTNLTFNYDNPVFSQVKTITTAVTSTITTTRLQETYYGSTEFRLRNY